MDDECRQLSDRFITHLAQDAERSMAQMTVLNGILSEVEGLKRLVDRGKGAGGVILFLLAGLAAMLPSFLDHMFKK